MSVVLTLVLVFAKVALGSFGGGLAALSFIHHELCVARPWLTEQGFTEVVSLAQMTPGPVALNSATFVGYKLAGFWGSLAASASLVLTPVLVLIVLMYVIEHTSGRAGEAVARVQKALRPAVAGLVFSAFWSVAKPILPRPALWAILALCFALLRFKFCRKYPQLIILFGAFAGVLCTSWLA